MLKNSIPIEASINLKLTTFASRSKSLLIEYKLASLFSTMINNFGSSKIIFLHNSEPIEPPPPVTKTTLFLIIFSL